MAGFPADLPTFPVAGGAYGPPSLGALPSLPLGFHPPPPLPAPGAVDGGGDPSEYSVSREDLLVFSSPGLVAGNRWPAPPPPPEDLAPLQTLSEMAAAYDLVGDDAHVWDMVSGKLEELRHFRDAKVCKHTFEDHDRQHERIKDAQVVCEEHRDSGLIHELKKFQGGNCEKHTSESGLQETRGIHSIDPFEIMVQPTRNRTDPTDILSELPFSSYWSEQDGEDTRNRKRKRDIVQELVMIMWSLLKQIMEKQEKMQKQLMEVIEKMESDRTAREEAWRKKQIELMEREMELRAQERLRADAFNQALASFSEKFSGQKIHFPKSSESLHAKVDQDMKLCKKKFPKSAESSHAKVDQAMKLGSKDRIPDPSNKRWPKSEVQALIKLRGAMEDKFRAKTPKGQLWGDISCILSSMGYMRSAKKCKEKWENINKYFRKAVVDNNNQPENSKACEYFHELEILYEKGIINPSSPPDKVDDELKD